MRRLRACAAIAASICLALLVSACATEDIENLAATMAPPPAPAPPPPPPEPTTPGGVRAEIVRWFSAAGYRPFQAAALADHARIESGFRPCVAGAAGLRYTFQWAGTRLRRLHEFTGNPGCPPLDKQLAFADNELRNNPRYACFWNATSEPSALAALRRGFGGGNC